MRKIQVALIAFLLVFLVLVCRNTIEQSSNNTDIGSSMLSIEEKLEDFEYMYKILKENYPFFEVNKRISGIDWLQLKDSYKNRISSTSNDLEFYKTLDTILSELNNGHTHMLDADDYQVFKDIFGNLSNEKDIGIATGNNYETWVKELNKEEAQRRYLGRYEDEEVQAPSSDNLEKEYIIPNNLVSRILVESKIAYLSISSFNGFNIERDMKIINTFLKSVNEYPVLIIDIRGNSGGSSFYWSDNLLPMLINEPLKSTSYLVYRGGAFNELFFNEGYTTLQKVESIYQQGLKHIPPEVKNDFKYYTKLEREIQPKESIGFNGKIYLLVDKHVFSSSEMFADFAKITGFATLVGQKTGGDGIGTDPIVCTLPNSGYVFRFPGVMGLTADGTCNEEFKTEPDIVVASPRTQFYWTDGVIQEILEIEK